MNSYILLISPFICSFFLLSNENFCHRFLGSYWSQCFQILCTPSGRQSVLCKWKLRCFYLLFSNFHFFHLSLLYTTYRHFFLSKISQQPLELGFWNLEQSLIVMSCIVYEMNSYILLISPFICSFFFLSNENFCHRFLGSYWSQCFQILCTPSGRQSVLCKWNLRC